MGYNRISEEATYRDKVIKHPGMSENFDNWVNKGVAGFYGKENVWVIMNEASQD